MKKTIFVVLITLLEFVIGQGQIPSWFKSLPQQENSAIISVGMTGNYSDRQLARKVAIHKARKTMAKQIRIRLIFEVQEMSDGFYRLFQPTFEQIYYENVLAYVDTTSSVVDSAFIDNRYYVLLSLFPLRENINSSIIGWGARPDWIEKLPDKPGYVYGIGMVANYSLWKNGWNDADELARFDACKNLKINTAAIRTKKHTDGYTDERKIMRQSVDIAVANSVIIERWYDQKQDIFYSLCRIPYRGKK